jgi:TM2 domain-containing membrane protein YozV
MKRDIPHFRIGLLLTEAGILAPKQLDDAIQQGEQEGTPFLRILVSCGYLKQHELQAVIRVQSLIWNGLLDVERAIKALNIVHTANVSIDEGLMSVGWARPEQLQTETIASPVRIAQGDSLRTQSTSGNGNGRSCQYCGTSLPANSTLCTFCTGENARGSIAIKARFEPVWQRETLPQDSFRITAANPARDPLLMAFLSGFCFAGIGQILLGQSAKGACIILLAVVLAFITSGASSLVVLPLAALDAYLLADKLRNGKSIGPWEFF